MTGSPKWRDHPTLLPENPSVAELPMNKTFQNSLSGGLIHSHPTNSQLPLRNSLFLQENGNWMDPSFTTTPQWKHI